MSARDRALKHIQTVYNKLVETVRIIQLVTITHPYNADTDEKLNSIIHAVTLSDRSNSIEDRIIKYGIYEIFHVDVNELANVDDIYLYSILCKIRNLLYLHALRNIADIYGECYCCKCKPHRRNCMDIVGKISNEIDRARILFNSITNLISINYLVVPYMPTLLQEPTMLPADIFEFPYQLDNMNMYEHLVNVNILFRSMCTQWIIRNTWKICTLVISFLITHHKELCKSGIVDSMRIYIVCNRNRYQVSIYKKIIEIYEDGLTLEIRIN